MSTSNTEPPQFEADERYTYVRKKRRPLTKDQERALYAYAVEAQECERMELRWMDDRVVIQLIRTEERKRV